MLTAADWIARLQLQPHQEGGFYRRIYTDARSVETAHGTRAAATSIHYLLSPQSPVGRFHRNRSLILHYLQQGGPVDYWLLSPAGLLSRHTLGAAPGQALFLEVPGGVWKASLLGEAAGFALVSEVVLPGFDFDDHQFLTSEQLGRDFPQHAVALAPLVHPTERL